MESGFSRIHQPSAEANSRRIHQLTGWTLALACLTRYEAWPVIVSALTIAAVVSWWQGATWPRAIARIASLALYPATAILGPATLIYSPYLTADCRDLYLVASNKLVKYGP